MGNNVYQGQLKGPFTAGVELMDLIREQAAVDVSYITHIGIETETPYLVAINGNDVEIGKTHIYEIGNTKITSIIFRQDTDNNSIVDYVIAK